MKILMITYEVTDRGGNFIRCFSLAKNLVKLGHQVTLLSGSPKITIKYNCYIKDGVQILETPDLISFRFRHDGWSPFQILFRCLYVINHQYNIIHGFGHRPAVFIPGFLHRFLYKKPYISDWCDLWGFEGIATLRKKFLGFIQGTTDEFLENFVYTRTDGLTVICRFLAKKGSKLINKSNILLLPVGANIDEIFPLSKKNMRKKHGIPHKCPIVVHLGNAPYDADLLADIFIELHRINPQVKLLFIGKPMPTFAARINKVDLEKCVINKGFIKHEKLSELLACGDIMLLPYSNRIINIGRYPNKIGDYLAAGRPIISNSTGDIKDLFNQKKIGLLVSESPKKFAYEINKLLNDKNRINLMGKNARNLAINIYSWLHLAKKLELFYNSFN